MLKRIAHLICSISFFGSVYSHARLDAITDTLLSTLSTENLNTTDSTLNISAQEDLDTAMGILLEEMSIENYEEKSGNGHIGTQKDLDAALDNLEKTLSIENFGEIVAPIVNSDKSNSGPKISTSGFYPISKIVLKYDKAHPNHLVLEELEAIKITLYVSSHRYIAKSEKENDGSEKSIEISIDDLNRQNETSFLSRYALEALLNGLMTTLKKEGIDWAYLRLAPGQIASNGKDLRPIKNHQLTILISTPLVAAVSTKYKDSKDTTKDRYSQSQDKRIKDNFPLTVADPSTGYPGDLINSNALNNYLYAINRHPGRRVDLEIGPTGIPGEVALDLVIREDRPYHFYFTANNNVPEIIHRWQESFGFIHTQVSGNDDILKFDYSTDSFDAFYSAALSYEAPLGKTLGTRWKVFGMQNRFISAEFGISQHPFKGTQEIASAEIVHTIFQKSRFFLDLIAELEYRHIHNKQHYIFSSVAKNFLFPSIGLNALRLTRETKLIASTSLESSMSSLFWDVRDGLDNLGRKNLSPNWAMLKIGVYGSFYLEPLFRRISNTTAPIHHLANEIVFTGQLQTAFNQRLIPQLEGVLGGLYSVRGYPQSTAAGDNLYLASWEYRLHLPYTFKNRPSACINLFGKPLRWAPAHTKGEVDWDLVFRAFYDVGKTSINQKFSSEADHILKGVGIGVELVVWHNIFLRYDWGTALRDVLTIDRGHHQNYFSSSLVF